MKKWFIIIPLCVPLISAAPVKVENLVLTKTPQLSYKPWANPSTQTEPSHTQPDHLKQSDWYAQAVAWIAASEYEIKHTIKKGCFVATNRKQNLKAFFEPDLFKLESRTESTDTWQLSLKTLGLFDGDKKLYGPERELNTTTNKDQIQYHHGADFITEYINNKTGIRQNFILKKDPGINNGRNPYIQFKLRADENWLVNKVHNREIQFGLKTPYGYDKKITYNSLNVLDARGRELDAFFEVENAEISICVNTIDAQYPITIDPLSTGTAGNPDSAPDDADQVGANFGYSVASAGDVNGDGFSDVIIGAFDFDDGPNAAEGRAFVYYGSATGISTTPNSILDDADQTSANFGISVAGAGDVNGDGYSDVIVGASDYDDAGNVNEGRAYIYHGSATGLSALPNNMPDDADQALSKFGNSVACAGDINNDGYSDIIIGAYGYTDGINNNEGRAFVYMGSAAGVGNNPATILDAANQAFANFGVCVAGAGDINGDGYSDIIVGAHQFDDGINSNEGRAYVYLGSAAGLSIPSMSILDDADQSESQFGYSVAGAGDLNGDGYSDVVIGALSYDVGSNVNEGRAFIYTGSASGVGATPAFTLNSSNQAGAGFGFSVACAGDVNGDGYSDIIIGAHQYDDGINANEGRAYIYLGLPSGLNTSPISVLDDADQTGAQFGICVASGGDVNGDGYSDVIIGANEFDDGANTNEGRAFVYHGSPTGLTSTFAAACDDAEQANAQFGVSVAGAGDINGDGFSDVIIGANLYDDGVFSNEGRVYIYHGSTTGLTPVPDGIVDIISQSNAHFGKTVAGAGDINGDGYADVLIGAPFYDDAANTDEGRAWIFYGSASGINSFTTYNTIDDANAANSDFGNNVAGAGDINGDGYGDVVIGSYFYKVGANNQEGRAFIYHGSAAGISPTPALTLNPTNQAGALFANSVASAGDVNGDGYNDVIIGAYFYSDFGSGFFFDGQAYVYHGSSTGLNPVASTVLTGPAVDQASFGSSVSAAGDVNGDGYGDVVIGAYAYTDGANAEEGRAYVFYGAATGVNAGAPAILDAANQANVQFGTSVCSAGDVNGDGYSDVAVGAPLFDDGFTNEGAVYVFYGSAVGVSTTAGYSVADANQLSAQFGNAVAGAGDINGDGYSDLIVGSQLFNDGANTDEGNAFLYYGNNGAGIRNNLRLYNTDLVTPIQQNNLLVPNLFGAGLYAKSFIGNMKGRLVWEVKKEGLPFSGNPITNSVQYLDRQPSFSNLGIAGTELKNQVQKTGFQNKIRARVEYDKTKALTGQVYGPWRYPVGYLLGGHGMHSVPLPVNLLSFTGQWTNENTATLSWITANENNLSHYVIQRSSDGRNFSDAGLQTVNNGGRNTYIYTDNSISSNTSQIYYRLMMVEYNGNKSYSRIITLTRNAIVKLTIAPNLVPAGQPINLSIEFYKANTPASLELYDAMGRKIMEQRLVLQRGVNLVELETQKLHAGNYLIVVAIGGERKQGLLLVI